MNTSAVGAIISKDLRAFSRDRFYLFMTILGLVFYVAIFWVLPDTVDETIEMGVSHQGLDAYFDTLTGGDEGLALATFDSTESLEAAIRSGEGPAVGLAFPTDFAANVASGSDTEVTLFVTAAVPPEVRGALSGMVREMAYLAAGNPALVVLPAETEVLLGTDRAGDQASLQETMRPMFVFFMLMIEMMALATLVATEIQQHTVTAILVTPASVLDVLVAKATLGTALAFSQAVLLMALIGSFGANSMVLLFALFLGAILVTGFGLLAGSVGRDFMSIIFWSVLFLIPLIIPAIAVLFPGTAATWIQALPSWGLVEAIVGSTTYGDGFAELSGPLLHLALWCVVAFFAGLAALSRKVVRI